MLQDSELFNSELVLIANDLLTLALIIKGLLKQLAKIYIMTIFKYKILFL